MLDNLTQGQSVALKQLRWLIIGVVVIIAPFIMKELELLTNFGLITQVNRALIFVALAQGLNIVVGLAGLLDLGYAAFFAIGAYTFGLLTWPTHDIEMPFFIAIWICAAVAAGFGVIIGAPTLRLRGDYLAIVTLAFGEIIPALVRNLGDFTFTFRGRVFIEDYNLTNGSQGLTPLGKPNFSFFESLFGLDEGALRVAVNPTFWYYAIVLTSILVLFAAIRLNNSRLGRAWKAIREDETAADFMGVDPIRTKLLAFAIGASFSGLAGAVYASMLGAIFPELFRFQVSIFLLIIVVLSGRGSIWGVLMGGLIIATFDGVFLAQVLPDIFNGEILPDYDVQSLRWVFFGTGLIIIMIFRPQGLFPPKTIERKAAPPPPEATQAVQG
jgi:branched-chain amino acid transport system permease protein